MICESFQPNCEPVEEYRNGANCVLYYAIKSIAASAELFVDYGLTRSRHVKDPAPCLCGTASCRGSLYRS